MNRLSWQHRLFIVTVALAAYAPTLRLGFLWDDHVMIEANPSLRQWTFQHLKHDFTTDVFDDGRGGSYYRPAQTLANRVDYTIWGLRPFGYHLTNLSFHIGNGLLLRELVLVLGFSSFTALFTGCLFVAHPIGVEQLMVIAGRAELMSVFFSLVSLLLLLRRDRFSVVGGLLAYLAALFAKESAVIAPALFALTLSFVRQLRERCWMIAVLSVMAVAFVWIRSHVVGQVLGPLDPWLAARFFLQAFPQALLRYALLIFVPWDLHSYRLLPPLSHFWFMYGTSILLLFAWLIKERHRWGLFCVAWFLLTLLPKAIVMITGGFMLDHWVYPGVFPVVLPIAIGLVKVRASSNRWLSWCARGGLWILLIGWGTLVHLNVALRGTDEKMYRWALQFHDSPWVHFNLGGVLVQTGRATEAIPHFELAYQRYPEDLKVRTALGLAYWYAGRPQRAIAFLSGGGRQEGDVGR